MSEVWLLMIELAGRHIYQLAYITYYVWIAKLDAFQPLLGYPSRG